MRAATLALVLAPLAGCAVVAGLGDFQKADQGGPGGGEGASGPSSTASATSSASSAGGGASGGAGAGGATTSSSGSGGAGAEGGGGGGGGGPASCFDGKKNGGETDLDCGGLDCPGCKIGQVCVGGTDCVTTKCGAGKCACNDHLVISEVRSRGLDGAADEIVEIYNPTANSKTVDATWTIESRNATGSVYVMRWTGAGQTIPAYGHLLIGGSAYAQAPAKDASLTSGITDESSVRLKQDTIVIDAICYCAALSAACNAYANDPTFSCEGPPATNPNGAGTDDDASMERLAGGTAGNCVDTIDSSKDFVPSMPAKPQNLASAVVPVP